MRYRWFMSRCLVSLFSLVSVLAVVNSGRADETSFPADTLMFDRACTPEDEVRFSLFTFKLPEKPRPAWDFQYVIHRVRQNREYGFRGRLIWKKWVSAEDCLREYRRWASQLAASR